MGKTRARVRVGNFDSARAFVFFRATSLCYKLGSGGKSVVASAVSLIRSGI